MICRTCGVQQAPGAVVEVCPVCADERQYVPPGGQRWTSLQELRDEGLRCELAAVEPGVTAVNVRPRLGIRQRALHVRTDAGAVLWDCVGFIDDEVVAAIGELGGVDAIAISHPHFYGAMVEWAHAFSAPIWISEADRQWVQRPDPAVRHWSDEVAPVAGARLVQCGGHFDGSAVLHVDGHDGAGVLFVGDTAAVAADRRHFTFMRSYPNYLPLGPTAVRRIAERAGRHPFDRAHGAWDDTEILGDAGGALRRSADRYVAWATGAR